VRVQKEKLSGAPEAPNRNAVTNLSGLG